jgi:hypothetical protein
MVARHDDAIGGAEDGDPAGDTVDIIPLSGGCWSI